MIKYFGYGSNMDFTALKAKGVVPQRSCPATLMGWRLRFNVEHFFRHEGGVGNIEHTGQNTDRVMGILHWCNDDDLVALDRLEAYGVGYDRVEVDLDTQEGRERGYAYIGLPAYVNDSCLPSQRYLNILVRGALTAQLDPAYIEALRSHEILPLPDLPPYQPAEIGPTLTHSELSAPLTVLSGCVFDMSAARPEHVVAQSWFGGKDVTVFNLKRMDSSDGTETLDDVVKDRLRADQRTYLNAYLHAFAQEYDYVAAFDYTSLPDEKQLA